MKIDGNGAPDRLKALVDSLAESERRRIEGGAEKTSPATAGDRARPGDRLDLSSLAQEFVQLRESIRQAPEIRETAVASLRDALASGRYVVDDQRLATLLADELLGGR